MTYSNLSIKNFVKLKNKKILFTPGPGSLLEENIFGLSPYFGRGDDDYSKIQKEVIKKIKKICGQKKLVFFQGSGSLAIEIALMNFIKGSILVIDTGYYSERVKSILKNLKNNFKFIKKIDSVLWKNMSQVKKKYDWICAVPVETSIALKIPIEELYKLKKITKSKLMLDATGSIGLEKNHKLSDICTFSSCKGLFGLTGSAFIGYKENPKNKINSFYMNLETHIQKKMTGPYHTIGSLFYVLKNYSKIKRAVQKNKENFLKKYKNYLVYKKLNQPMLCTFVNKNVKKKK